MNLAGWVWRAWACVTGSHHHCRGGGERSACGCPCHWVTVKATRERLKLDRQEA